MIARIGLLLAAIALAAAAPAKRDWSAVAVKAPDGAYVIGNPASRVRMVEYVSYTCPHCARFAADSREELAAMVRGGTVRMEVRNLVFNALDLAALLTVRCAGRRFPAAHAAVFAAQDAWMARFGDWEPANRARVALYPDQDRIRAYADGAGLSGLVAGQGVPAAALARCQGDPAELAQLLRLVRAVPPEVHATPAFEVNGKLVTNVLWSGLQPILRAAGAR